MSVPQGVLEEVRRGVAQEKMRAAQEEAAALRCSNELLTAEAAGARDAVTDLLDRTSRAQVGFLPSHHLHPRLPTPDTHLHHRLYGCIAADAGVAAERHASCTGMPRENSEVSLLFRLRGRRRCDCWQQSWTRRSLTVLLHNRSCSR